MECRRELRIEESNGVYSAIITFDQREIFRSDGWLWDAGIKRWTTRDHLKAEKFKAFMSDEALATYSKWAAEAQGVLDPSFAVSTTFAIPTPPGKVPDPFQLAGAEFMFKRKTTLLADPPGMGKTVQIALLLNALPATENMLIICPSYLTLHWVRLIQAWDIHGRTVGRCSKKVVRERKPEGGYKSKTVYIYPDTQIVAVGMDNTEPYRDWFIPVVWDNLVIDEAQYIINKTTKRYKNIFGCRANSKRKQEKLEGVKYKNRFIAATGTPIPSRPVELFPLLEKLDPNGLGANYISYIRKYCAAVDYGKFTDVSGSSNLPELQARMRAKFMIRRPASVMKLRPMTREVVEIPNDGFESLLNEEASAFEKVLKAILSMPGEAVAEASEDYERTILERIDAKFGHLMGLPYEERVGALTDPLFAVPFEELSSFRKRFALAKVPVITEYLENILANGSKVVCFFVHTEVGKKLLEAFPKSCYIDGSVPATKRQAIVDKFQEDDNVRLLLGNIKAAGTGYTMTAADRGVMAEFSWVPSDIDQAELRIHRYGKTGSSHWDHLVVEGSLDARMIKTVLEKALNLRQIFDLSKDQLDIVKAIRRTE